MPTRFSNNPDDQYLVIVVSSDSMIDAGIHSGDIVMYRVTESAPPGSLAVIATPNGFAVKFYHLRADGTVALESANPEFRTQTWLDTELVVRGVVVLTRIDWGRDGTQNNHNHITWEVSA